VQQLRRLAQGYAGLPGTPAGSAVMPQNPASAYWAARWGAPLAPSASTAPLDSDTSPIIQPLPPGIQQAVEQYGQYARGGNLGFSALTGNAGAQGQFMNPYLAQMNPFFAQQRQQAIEQANQQATLAGAFGGDRSQIGAAIAGNQADIGQAGFNYQAFEDAMRRAQFASQLGLGATGLGALLPQQYAAGQLGLLQQGLGPYGQTQTQQMQRDPWSQLLGLGLTAGGFLLGGPAGAAAVNYGFGGDTSTFGQGFGPPTPGEPW